jgi:hypothetical protein
MGHEGLRPTVKKLEAEQPASQQDQVEVAGDEEREERVFNPAGYEAHLVETIEKDILQRNPDVTWTKVAGLHEAKAILQEAMVLPILMPDFFKVAFWVSCIIQSSHLLLLLRAILSLWLYVVTAGSALCLLALPYVLLDWPCIHCWHCIPPGQYCILPGRPCILSSSRAIRVSFDVTVPTALHLDLWISFVWVVAPCSLVCRFIFSLSTLAGTDILFCLPCLRRTTKEETTCCCADCSTCF